MGNDIRRGSGTQFQGQNGNRKKLSQRELMLFSILVGIVLLLAIYVVGPMLQGAREKTDYMTAKNIETALRTFSVQSQIVDPTVSARMFLTPSGGKAINDIKATPNGAKKLITYLMDKIYVHDMKTNNRVPFGPYLPKSTDKSDFTQYAPQWNVVAGGSHKGWEIEITKSTNTVMVRPSITDYSLIIKP